MAFSALSMPSLSQEAGESTAVVCKRPGCGRLTPRPLLYSHWLNAAERGSPAGEPWFGAIGPDGLGDVLWQDGERVVVRTRRDGADGKSEAVLMVLPTAEHPTLGTLNLLAHEYKLKDELDGAWAVRPLELVRERGRTMLVLESPDGEPLDRPIGPPMEIGKFLRLAIALAVALGRLHECGLVQDIKPSNMLVNSVTGQVWLTGFGITSRLPRERQLPEPPEFIAGTLAYMAPEQTGRMNRSIDCRSDLYSLGVTFYQILRTSRTISATI